MHVLAFVNVFKVITSIELHKNSIFLMIHKNYFTFSITLIPRSLLLHFTKIIGSYSTLSLSMQNIQAVKKVPNTAVK